MLFDEKDNNLNMLTEDEQSFGLNRRSWFRCSIRLTAPEEREKNKLPMFKKSNSIVPLPVWRICVSGVEKMNYLFGHLLKCAGAEVLFGAFLILGRGFKACWLCKDWAMAAKFKQTWTILSSCSCPACCKEGLMEKMKIETMNGINMNVRRMQGHHHQWL